MFMFMVLWLYHHSKRALWQFFVVAVSIFHRIIIYIVFWCSSEYGYIFYLDLGSLITLSHLMMDSCHTQPSGRSLRNRHRGPLHTWLYYSLVQKTNVVPFPPTENNAPRAQPLLCDFCWWIFGSPPLFLTSCKVFRHIQDCSSVFFSIKLPHKIPWIMNTKVKGP